MKLHSVLFWAAIISVAADGKNDTRKEQAGVIGDWKLVLLDMEGEKTSFADQAKEEKGGNFIRAAITADKITLSDSKCNSETWEYKVDPARKPKWIDLMPAGQTIMGIYAVEKNTLRICLMVDGKGRPKDFTSPKGSQSVLAEFKREKKR